VPCGGSTGCVIRARKIRESAELLAKDWQRVGIRALVISLMHLDIPSYNFDT
jgi:hypothetical protein